MQFWLTNHKRQENLKTSHIKGKPISRSFSYKTRGILIILHIALVYVLGPRIVFILGRREYVFFVLVQLAVFSFEAKAFHVLLSRTNQTISVRSYGVRTIDRASGQRGCVSQHKLWPTNSTRSFFGRRHQRSRQRWVFWMACAFHYHGREEARPSRARARCDVMGPLTPPFHLYTGRPGREGRVRPEPVAVLSRQRPLYVWRLHDSTGPTSETYRRLLAGLPRLPALPVWTGYGTGR
jgi:hypothetical protein